MLKVEYSELQFVMGKCVSEHARSLDKIEMMQSRILKKWGRFEKGGVGVYVLKII